MDFEFDPSKSRNRKYPDESIYQSAPAPFQEADTSFQLQEMEKEIEQLFKLVQILEELFKFHKLLHLLKARVLTHDLRSLELTQKY